MALSHGAVSRMHSFMGSTAYLPDEIMLISDKRVEVKINAPALPFPIQIFADEHTTRSLLRYDVRNTER
jgi:hypothetical protein